MLEIGSYNASNKKRGEKGREIGCMLLSGARGEICFLFVFILFQVQTQIVD